MSFTDEKVDRGLGEVVSGGRVGGGASQFVEVGLIGPEDDTASCDRKQTGCRPRRGCLGHGDCRRPRRPRTVGVRCLAGKHESRRVVWCLDSAPASRLGGVQPSHSRPDNGSVESTMGGLSRCYDGMFRRHGGESPRKWRTLGDDDHAAPSRRVCLRWHWSHPRSP
jgi:hypothetical protein